jgi:integrase
MADILTRTSAKTGKQTYQVRIRRTGYPLVVKTFKSKTLAGHWARDEESKLLKGLPVLTKSAATLTFGDAIADYRRAHRDISPSEKSRLNQLDADMHDLAVVNLTSSMLSSYVQTMQDTEVRPPAHRKKASKLYNGEVKRLYADSTVRKVYYVLKKVMEWHSQTRRYPIDPNLFKMVTPPNADIKRTRRLEGDEEARLLAACDECLVNQRELRTVIQFALETGMRAGEIMKLEWHEVKLESRDINIPKEKTKTDRARQVPMTSVCVKLLKNHLHTKGAGESRVFWQWKDSHALYQRFRVALKNAAIEDFRFHDLRHEATSRFYERTKLRDVEIARITGHSDLRTLKRYANLRTNELIKHLW